MILVKLEVYATDDLLWGELWSTFATYLSPHDDVPSAVARAIELSLLEDGLEDWFRPFKDDDRLRITVLQIEPGSLARFICECEVMPGDIYDACIQSCSLPACRGSSVAEPSLCSECRARFCQTVAAEL